jgi:hypothetical protein
MDQDWIKQARVFPEFPHQGGGLDEIRSCANHKG